MCLRVDPLKDTAGSPFGKALSVPAWSKCTYQTLSALSAFTTLCGVLTSLEKTLPIFMNLYALLTALGEPLQAFTMAKKRHWDPARIWTWVFWMPVRCSYQLSHWSSGIGAEDRWYISIDTEPLAFFTSCCGMQTAWTLTALAKFLPPFTSLYRTLTASTKPLPWFTRLSEILTALAEPLTPFTTLQVT